MDAVRVSALRESLAGTGWLESTRAFAGALRHTVTRRSGGGLLLVGTERYEPWHLAAHLGQEAGLDPVLLRHRPAPDAPSHLRYGLETLTTARRGSAVLVVAPTAVESVLLERVQDARRGGVTVLALDTGDRELSALAHEQLTVPEAEPEPFDLVQHLVSSAAGARSRPGLGAQLARLAERLLASPVAHW